MDSHPLKNLSFEKQHRITRKKDIDFQPETASIGFSTPIVVDHDCCRRHLLGYISDVRSRLPVAPKPDVILEKLSTVHPHLQWRRVLCFCCRCKQWLHVLGYTSVSYEMLTNGLFRFCGNIFVGCHRWKVGFDGL